MVEVDLALEQSVAFDGGPLAGRVRLRSAASRAHFGTVRLRLVGWTRHAPPRILAEEVLAHGFRVGPADAVHLPFELSLPEGMVPSGPAVTYEIHAVVKDAITSVDVEVQRRSEPELMAIEREPRSAVISSA